MARQLPQELYDEIISHLWDDAPALRAASTTARALCEPAQRHLFSHIVLHSPSLQTSKTAPRLRSLLERSPHLALHVEVLEVCGRETPAFAFHAREEALMFCLPLMSRLRALRVGYRMDLRRECLLFAPATSGAAGAGTGKGGAGRGVKAGEDHERDHETSLLQVLADALSLPSLVCVEFAHLPVELLAHCRGLRTLALQDPDTHDEDVRAWVAGRTQMGAGAGLTLGTGGSRDPVPLEALQLDYASGEVTDALRRAGIALTALRTLCIRALDYTDAAYAAGLGAALRACAGSLTALELDEPNMHSLARTAARGADPIPWGSLRALRLLRVNLAFPSETDADDASAAIDDPRALAAQHLLYLSRVLVRLRASASPALEELVLQDYTDYWCYFTEDLYVSAWARIVALLADRAHFPRFRTLVVDSKRSVTQKIQLHILDRQRLALPFAVRLGPGHLDGKLGRSFLRALFGSDWQASDS